MHPQDFTFTNAFWKSFFFFFSLHNFNIAAKIKSGIFALVAETFIVVEKIQAAGYCPLESTVVQNINFL